VNLALKLEPIERIEPYVVLSLGQSIFQISYADSGKTVVVEGRTVRLSEEQLKGWTGGIGFGIETPLSSWLYWGLRGRYHFHRWQASTDSGRFLPYHSGGSSLLEGTLKLRF
jgi:hypothetical protein